MSFDFISAIKIISCENIPKIFEIFFFFRLSHIDDFEEILNLFKEKIFKLLFSINSNR